MTYSYQQPTKNRVRLEVLSHAVSALTRGRTRSAIVRPNELQNTIQYAKDVLNDKQLSSQVDSEVEAWMPLFESQIGRKRASELKVLYLCGPEPLNDLSVLLSCGVVPENVWAVESVAENLDLAWKSLANTYPQVRLHPGDLSDLLRVYPGRFDIVYYDACASVFRDGELGPILQLLVSAKLEPISALITTFSNVPPKYRTESADAITAFFRYRYNDLPRVFWKAKHLDPAICEYDPQDLAVHVKAHFEEYYSDFITRLIDDLARYWIPNCRALALSAVRDDYLIDKVKLEKWLADESGIDGDVMTVEEYVKLVGRVALSPSGYPVFSFYQQLQESRHSLAKAIGDTEINGRLVGDLIGAASILDKAFDGHWNAIGKKLRRAIECSWFDINLQFSCDVPLPNLLINSLCGIYGHPYFVNPRRCKRYEYIAKRARMFTDVFIFDQCRYFFEWFPVISLAPSRFRSRAFQVLARCIIDRIGWADHRSDSHPFRYAAVAGIGETQSACPNNFERRKVLRP